MIDGTDQFAFHLQQFISLSKSARGPDLWMKAISVSKHQSKNKLTLFTKTQGRKTSADNIFEAFHKYINYKVWKFSLFIDYT